MVTKKKAFLFFIMIVLLAFLTGCHSVSLVEKSRTITVQGTGKVLVVPDIASFTISVSELAETTKEAQSKTNEKVAMLLDMIRKAGVPEKDIVTASLEFRPEYRWREGEQILLGQRVSQTIRVTIRGIDADSSPLAQLIDMMGEVSHIVMSSVLFSKEDTSDAYGQSRTLAMNKAIQKGQEYAQAGGMRLGKPLVVQDYSQNDYQIAPRAMMAKSADMFALESSFTTDVPIGELEVVSTVSVVFELL